MLRRTVLLFGLLMVLSIATVVAPSHKASAFNQRIIVYATVVQQRAVYVGSDGMIYKVAGNTSDNITPVAYDQNNKQLEMTDSILQQYDSFLKQHNYKLEAGKVYKVNSLQVNAAVNEQTITVTAAPEKVSLSVQ
jgi:hypothetical protein